MCCPFSPRDVLNEIWDLTESFSEDFLKATDTYACFFQSEYICSPIRALAVCYDKLDSERVDGHDGMAQFDLLFRIVAWAPGTELCQTKNRIPLA